MVESKQPKSEQKWDKLTENVLYITNGTSNLLFKIDTSKVLRPSKSGKTDIIATSGRPKQMEINGKTIFVNLTIYQYRD